MAVGVAFWSLVVLCALRVAATDPVGYWRWMGVAVLVLCVFIGCVWFLVPDVRK